MRVARIVVSVALAMLCSAALAADAGKGKDKGKDKPKTKAESTSGTLAEATDKKDAKVIAVLKAIDGDKSIDVIAASDEVATQIKDLAKKGASVNITGQFNADRTSITVSVVAEAGASSDKKPKKKK